MGTAVTDSQRGWRNFVRRTPGPAVIVKRRVQASMFVLLALLVAVLGTGMLATYNLYRSAEDRYIGVVLPLRGLTQDVLFQMKREESGVRGYMITTDRRSLDPYKAGRRMVLADLNQIAALTRGRSLPGVRLREVRRAAVALHGFYDRLIVFVADGKEGQKIARQDVLEGTVLASRFSRSASLMQTGISRFVQTTRNQQRTTFHRTLAVLSIAGFLALAVAGALLTQVPERLRRLYASEEDARLRAEQGANAARALEHVSDAVLLVDDAGAIRFWNEAGEQLFEVGKRSAVGSQAARVVPDYDRLVEAAHRQDGFVPVLIGGSERWLSPALSVFEGGSVLAVRDATEGYILERARADFVATASHELRTPLTAVFGGARTLIAHGDRLDAGQKTSLLRMIEQESEHLVQIVDQLLISAQLDRGALPLDVADCDVSALCVSVVESARLRAPSGIMLTFATPTSLAPVRCDESLLRQVLVNLVENALKYSVGGGQIDVRLHDEPGRVRIEVKDRGLGIPPVEQERIFEKFYRLDAAMSRGVGGSGLGLFISREIVTQMGGSLSVHSVEGKGSTFTVTLPRHLLAA
jgi:two-component system, OmpR family, phosphate regulon sensor histidine kinase PhoR